MSVLRRLCRYGLIVAALLGSFGAAAPIWGEVPQSPGEITLSFAPLVKAAAPAVVNIYTKTIVRQSASPFFDDPFFRQFFGDDFGFGAPRERVQNSLGSGVILRPDGLIVTNRHVIAGADQITVVLADQREFEARLVAAEEKFDLALLKIDPGAESLPILALRDSDDLEVGDLVLAIGNPFGVGQTVTSGIVSALARTRTGIGDAGYFIQTDAAINPGNSGGALIALDGRLVGINTAIYSKGGGSIGIGFAIPSNMVAAFLAAESEGGKLIRPWIGLSGETLTAPIAASLGLKPGGIVVHRLYPGGPADRAGLAPGDILKTLNGRAIADSAGLRFRLTTLKIGEQAIIGFLRKGTPGEAKIDLVAAPGSAEVPGYWLRGRQPLAGARIADLTPALGNELGIAEWSGVVVLEVKRNSLAAEYGFRSGDIVLNVNGKSIGNVEDLREPLQRSSGSWRIEVSRDGAVKTIEIE